MTSVPLRGLWLWQSIGWVMISTVIVLSLIPSPHLHETVPQGDKYMHFIAYFGLMAWFAQIYHRFWPRFSYAIGLIVLGAVIELLQGLTGYRQADVMDMGMNSLGVLSAWLVIRGQLATVLERLGGWLRLD